MLAAIGSLAGRLAGRDRAADLGLRGWIDQQPSTKHRRRQRRETGTCVRIVHASTRRFGLPRPTSRRLRQRRTGEDFTRQRESGLSRVQGRRPSLPPPPSQPRVHVREQWPATTAEPQVRGLHAFTWRARLPRCRPRRRIHASVDDQPAGAPIQAGHDSLRTHRTRLAFNPHSKSARVMTSCQQHDPLEPQDGRPLTPQTPSRRTMGQATAESPWSGRWFAARSSPFRGLAEAAARLPWTGGRADRLADHPGDAAVRDARRDE